MRITMKLFALARDLAGVESLELELPSQATLADAKSELLRQVPALAEILDHCSFAVNEQYATNPSELQANDVLACIPPVSGG